MKLKILAGSVTSALVLDDWPGGHDQRLGFSYGSGFYTGFGYGEDYGIGDGAGCGTEQGNGLEELTHED